MRSGVAVVLAAVAGLASAEARAQSVIALPEEDRRLDGRPVLEYTVGAAEGEDWELFSSIGSVAFDAAGNLFVLDRGNHRVLVFDRDGDFVRQIARRGGGPGELQSPAAMTVTRDGHVVVTDLGRMAFSVFTGAGEFVRNVPFDAGTFPAFDLHAHPRAGVVTTLRRMMMLRDGPGSTPETTTIPIHWHPLTDSARVIFEAPAPEQRVTSGGGSGDNVTRIASVPAFAPTLRWGVTPDGGLVVASEAEYDVRLIGADGAVRARLTRPVQPRPVTDRDREAARERRREQLESGLGMVRVVVENGRTSMSAGGRAMPEELIRRQIDAIEFADEVPVIRDLAVDPRGTMWIAREGGAGAQNGPIDLVRTNGEYVGTVAGQELPRAFSSDGRAAWVRTDDLGIERIIVARLPSGWR